jgi:hypothetical protein
VRRWLAVALGLVLAGVALWVLARARSDHGPHDEIDDGSRQRLEQVLREPEAS